VAGVADPASVEFMQASETIWNFLKQVRRRERARAWILAWTAAVASIAVGVLFGLGLAALSHPDDLRAGWVFIAAGVVGAGWCLWRFGFRRHRAVADAAELARWVEGQRPELGSSLVSAVEIAGSRPDTMSVHLIDATTALAAQRVQAIDARRLGDANGHRRRVTQAAVVTVIAVGALGIAPTLAERGWEQLTRPTPESEQDGARWVDVAVSQLDLEIKPPSYTKLGVRRLPRGTGDITALVGSEVALTTTTVVEGAVEAALVLESNPEARWGLTLERQGAQALVRGGFRVGRDDRYRFVLLLGDGTIIQERTWRRVTAQADLAPEVTLLLPESDLAVKPDDRIEFFFEASDDYGLERVDLVAVGDDGRELLRQTVREARGARVEKGHGDIEVARLGLEPGEAADVFFEARDLNDQDREKGPGIGKSAVRRLTLYSPADEHDAFIALLEKLMDQLIDVLADRVESPLAEPSVKPWPVVAPAVQKVVRTMSGLLGDLDGLVRNFSTDPLASEALREGLRAVRERLLAVHEQESAHLTRWETAPEVVNLRVMLDLLVALNREGVTATETSIFELKRLIDGARKDTVMDIGRQLLETQNEMMELLKKLKETDDPAVREQALKKLKKLQEKMRQLQQELAKLQEKSPYENQNPQQRPSDRQMEVSDMKSTMQRIEELMKEGKYDEAMKLLEELNQSTQEMMAGLQEDLDAAGGRMNAAAAKRQMEFNQELDAVADGQKGLQGETGDVGQEMDERAAREAREAHGEALEQARQGAAGMRKALDGARQGGMHPEDRAALDGLSKKAQALEQALDEGRLDRAAELSKELSEGIGQLQGEVGESAAREMDRERLSELREAGKKLGEAAGQAQQVGEQLSEAGAGQERQPNPPEQQKLDRIGQQQRSLKERLDRLQGKLDEMEQDSPGIKDEIGPKLDEAGKKMNEAGEQLGDGKPRDAESRQQEALERLRQAQQSMQERQQQKGGRQNGQGDGVGINDPKEKVGIPQDDPYAAPRNLREEILRAMQEDAPDAYKEAIRRFYEELTR
jgi:hypothetical protein